MPEKFKSIIRNIPDFPKPGIQFKDITPLLSNGPEFRRAIDMIAERYKDHRIDQVVAVESRGFIVGAPVAAALRAGFVPVRKKGKLPHPDKLSHTYELEYGTDTLEMHQDALIKGHRVLVVDDLLATGGTVGAVVNMIDRLGAELVEAAFLIELEFLKGREKLKGHSVYSVIQY